MVGWYYLNLKYATFELLTGLLWYWPSGIRLRVDWYLGAVVSDKFDVSN
jgi:hypothetical protein